MQKLFDDYISSRCGHLKPKSIYAKKNDFKKFANFFQKELSSTDVRLWTSCVTEKFLLNLKENKIANRTINRALSTIKQFGESLRDDFVINHSPCKGVKQKRIAKNKSSVSIDSCKKIISTVNKKSIDNKSKHCQWKRNNAVFLLFCTTDLTTSELCEVRLKQFSAKDLCIKDLTRARGKNTHNVRISPVCCEKILDYINNQRVDKSDYLFTNRYGGKISSNGIRKFFKEIKTGEDVKINPSMIKLKLKIKSKDLIVPKEVKPVFKTRVENISRLNINQYSVFKRSHQ